MYKKLMFKALVLLQNIIVSWKTSTLGLFSMFYPIYTDPTILTDNKRLVTLLCTMMLGLIARDGDKSSEETGADKTVGDHGIDLKANMPMIFVCFSSATLMLLALTGCTASVAATKSSSDASKAVMGTQQDVIFIANLIANNWAQHETEQANRLYQAAIRADTVSATVVPQANAIPNVVAPAVTVQVVAEPTRTILQNKLNADLAAIAVGQQQIYQSVVNRFQGNLTAAQNLLQGQQQYYATAGAQQTTLQQGTQTILDLFQQFAPVIATAITPTKKS